MFVFFVFLLAGGLGGAGSLQGMEEISQPQQASEASLAPVSSQNMEKISQPLSRKELAEIRASKFTAPSPQQASEASLAPVSSQNKEKVSPQKNISNETRKNISNETRKKLEEKRKLEKQRQEQASEASLAPVSSQNKEKVSPPPKKFQTQQQEKNPEHEKFMKHLQSKPTEKRPLISGKEVDLLNAEEVQKHSRALQEQRIAEEEKEKQKKDEKEKEKNFFLKDNKENLDLYEENIKTLSRLKKDFEDLEEKLISFFKDEEEKDGFKWMKKTYEELEKGISLTGPSSEKNFGDFSRFEENMKEILRELNMTPSISEERWDHQNLRMFCNNLDRLGEEKLGLLLDLISQSRLEKDSFLPVLYNAARDKACEDEMETCALGGDFNSDLIKINEKEYFKINLFYFLSWYKLVKKITWVEREKNEQEKILKEYIRIRDEVFRHRQELIRDLKEEEKDWISGAWKEKGLPGVGDPVQLLISQVFERSSNVHFMLPNTSQEPKVYKRRSFPVKDSLTQEHRLGGSAKKSHLIPTPFKEKLVENKVVPQPEAFYFSKGMASFLGVVGFGVGFGVTEAWVGEFLTKQSQKVQQWIVRKMEERSFNPKGRIYQFLTTKDLSLWGRHTVSVLVGALTGGLTFQGARLIKAAKGA